MMDTERTLERIGVTLVFAPEVHRRLIPFAVRCVQTLEIRDSCIRFERRPRAAMDGAFGLLRSAQGAGIPYADLWYCSELRYRDLEVVRLGDGALCPVRLVEMAVLHELLHYRYPDMPEDEAHPLAYLYLIAGAC